MTIFTILLTIFCVCAAVRHELCGNGNSLCSSDIPCPAGPGGTCPEGSTCCPAGCCSLLDAVCCPDQVHCCPAGTECESETQMCVKKGSPAYNMLTKTVRRYSDSTSKTTGIQTSNAAAFLTNALLKDTPCPLGPGGSCPGHMTCCPQGCCIFSNGICCKDQQYCCPTGTTCDPDHGLCVQTSSQVLGSSDKKANDFGFSPILKADAVQQSLSVKPEVVYCPGGQFYCPDFNTCCITPRGTWMCCPLPSATCCPDGVHCCRSGYHCDPTSTRCIYGNSIEFSSKKIPAFSIQTSNTTAYLTNALLKDTPCPPGPGGSCPGHMTCCPQGCCIFSNGICCKDQQYCCPSGTTCDPDHGLCVQTSSQVLGSSDKKTNEFGFSPILKADAVQQSLSVKSEVVYCPGGQFYCPDFNTCCITPSRTWMCCPLPSATCCPDGVHCCRSGYHCDPTSTYCIYGNSIELSSKKIPAFSIQTSKASAFLTNALLKDTPCPTAPGGSCPGLETCCSQGCCIFPNGICCKDQQYCCPSGTTCDPDHGFCDPTSNQVLGSSDEKTNEFGFPSILKAHAVQQALSVKPEVVYCAGGQFYCPDFNTCCITPSGTWMCCPLPSATCCPDGVHCCRSGYHCDPTSTYCMYGNSIEFSSKKVPAFSLKSK